MEEALQSGMKCGWKKRMAAGRPDRRVTLPEVLQSGPAEALNRQKEKSGGSNIYEGTAGNH